MTYVVVFVIAFLSLVMGYLCSWYLHLRENPILGADMTDPARGLTLKELVFFYWNKAATPEQELQADIETRTHAIDAVLGRKVWVAGRGGLQLATGFFLAQLDGQAALVIEASEPKETHDQDSK